MVFMKRYIKRIMLVFSVISIILVVCYTFFQISKSRTFQFFGELVHRVDTEEKVIALTFDDGPTQFTETVLNTLDEKGVKATFFVIGKSLEQFPDLGKAIVDSGHELGNHSYTHQRFLLKSQHFINDEIEKTNMLIRQAGYEEDIHFRPPYGKKLFGLPWYLSQHKIKTIMIDLEPDTYGSTKRFFLEYTLEKAKPGSILLLHPFCENCSAQREAIGEIIDAMQERGYRFVTISELLRYKKD